VHEISDNQEISAKLQLKTQINAYQLRGAEVGGCSVATRSVEVVVERRGSGRTAYRKRALNHFRPEKVKENLVKNETVLKTSEEFTSQSQLCV